MVALLWNACMSDCPQKANSMVVRKMCKKLLDRNLLMGSTSDGVYLHDIVRDYVRQELLGGNDPIREQQRDVVRAIIGATPAQGGWSRDDSFGRYVIESIRQHMAEALTPDRGPDSDIVAWLDSDDDVLADGHRL